VRILEEQWLDVSTDIYIRPLPAPLPLVLEDTFAAPDPAAYDRSEYWPSSPVRLSGTGYGNGHPVAGILVSPYRFSPATGSLQKLVDLRISVDTEESLTEPLFSPRTDASRMLIVTDASLVSSFEELAQRRTDEGIITEIVTMTTVYSQASGRDDAETLRNYIIDYYTTNGLDYVLFGGDTDLVPFRYAFAMECEAGFAPREDSLPCDLYFSDLDVSSSAG